MRLRQLSTVGASFWPSIDSLLPPVGPSRNAGVPVKPATCHSVCASVSALWTDGRSRSVHRSLHVEPSDGAADSGQELVGDVAASSPRPGCCRRGRRTATACSAGAPRPAICAARSESLPMNETLRNSIRSLPVRTYLSTIAGITLVRVVAAEGALEVRELDERHAALSGRRRRCLSAGCRRSARSSRSGPGCISPFLATGFCSSPPAASAIAITHDDDGEQERPAEDPQPLTPARLRGFGGALALRARGRAAFLACLGAVRHLARPRSR